MVHLDYLQDTSSKPQKKIRFVIYFIIIVVGITSAFTLWKSHLRDPFVAIQVACSKTDNHSSCFESISRLHKNTTTPSKPITLPGILTLSLQAGLNKLDSEIIPTINNKLASGADPKTTVALKKCKNLLSDSMRWIHGAMAITGSVDADTMVFGDANLIEILEDMIIDARHGIDGCFKEGRYIFRKPHSKGAFRMKMGAAWSNVDDCYNILYYRDEIHQELNPSIASVLEPVRFYLTPGLVLAFLPFMFSVLLVFLFVRIKA